MSEHLPGGEVVNAVDPERERFMAKIALYGGENQDYEQGLQYFADTFGADEETLALPTEFEGRQGLYLDALVPNDPRLLQVEGGFQCPVGSRIQKAHASGEAGAVQRAMDKMTDGFDAPRVVVDKNDVEYVAPTLLAREPAHPVKKKTLTQ